MRYLLDTNVLSDLVRSPQGRVKQRITEVGEALICTSIVVSAELHYGVWKKNSDRLTRELEVVLRAIEVLPLETPTDIRYGVLRTHLERAGRPIGGNDLLIAAQALSLGCTLVTNNEREFSRVPDLRLENWLR